MLVPGTVKISKTQTTHRWERLGIVALVSLVTALALPSARLQQVTYAVEIPPPGNPTYLQTNGPITPIHRGDWYTTNENGTAAGYHYFKISVPCGWPSGSAVNVDLYSPEMNSTAPLPDEDNNGTPADTSFEMYAAGTVVGPGPDQPAAGSGIAGSLRTYAPGSNPESWSRFYTLAAPVACGSYVLRSESSDDDQNSFRLRVGFDDDTDPANAPPSNYDNPDGLPGTNDELVVSQVQASYQHDTGTTTCLTLYEYVAPNQADVDFHNFDMDDGGTVTYVSPSGGQTAGTISTNASWNTGTQTSRGAGDVIDNPEPGWWEIETCISNHNQFIQEGQISIPSYHTQPPSPSMEITKSDGLTSVVAGQTVTYTLAFANTSDSTSAPGAANNVVLTDTLPVGMTYVSCAFDAPYSGTCAEVSPGVVTYTLDGWVSAGASGSVSLTAQVNAGVTGELTNTVTLGYQDQLGNTYPEETATDVDTASLPTSTATPSNTATNTATETSTNTPISTDTATVTPTDTETATATSTHTSTSTPTNTPEDTSTATSTETPTSTLTSEPTETPTGTPTGTATDTVTNTPTNTLISTDTVTNTPISTFTSTATNTSATSTSTYTANPSSTGTSSPTRTTSSTDTVSPTNTSSATHTTAPTDTPIAVSTDTSTPTLSSTSTRTNTPINTGTGTVTGIATTTPFSTNTATHTRTGTATNTAATSTPTYTVNPSSTGTSSPTRTPSSTGTASPTGTSTATRTTVPTDTPIAAGTETSTPTSSPTSTRTNTPANTATGTVTGIATDTPFSTNTATQTQTSIATDTAAVRTPTFTVNPSSTNTRAATSTPSSTDTVSPAGTNTAVSTTAPTDTPASVGTNTSTHTASPTSTRTSTPANTAGSTATATATNTSALGSLGDFVWNDLDRDGVQDPAEPGIPGFEIVLFNSQGTPVATATTDGSGNYDFPGVTPGNYYLEFVPSTGYVFSPQDQGDNDALDSDANPANGRTTAITLLAGQVNLTVDAGLYEPSAPTGTPSATSISTGTATNTPVSTNTPGIQRSPTSTPVLPTNTSQPGATNTTGPSATNTRAPAATDTVVAGPTNTPGPRATDTQSPKPTRKPRNTDTPEPSATHTPAPPTDTATPFTPATATGIPTSTPSAWFGDLVWDDKDIDGLQEDGEVGIPGVTVRLISGQGDLVATAITNNSGNYRFEGVAPGNYWIEFLAPPGYLFGPRDQGANDDVDSDADLLTGRTDLVLALAGQSNLTFDAGLYQPQLPTTGTSASPTHTPGTATTETPVSEQSNTPELTELQTSTATTTPFSPEVSTTPSGQTETPGSGQPSPPTMEPGSTQVSVTDGVPTAIVTNGLPDVTPTGVPAEPGSDTVSSAASGDAEGLPRVLPQTGNLPREVLAWGIGGFAVLISVGLVIHVTRRREEYNVYARWD